MKPGETKLIPDDRIMLGAPHHVCIVVRDVERAAALYSALLGIGPFTVREVHSAADAASVHGRPAEYTVKFGYARTASITIELVETVQGHTVYQEFYDQYGEGLHHLGFQCPPPLDRELAKWRAAGFEASQVNRRDDPVYGWAYLDTQERLGFVVEIVCDPPLGWWESLTLAGDLKGPLGRA